MTEMRDHLNRMLREIVMLGIAARLKEAGYRRRGLRFVRQVGTGPVWHVIEVQRIRYSAPDETNFRVVAGVFVAGLGEAIYGHDPVSPMEPASPIRICPDDLDREVESHWRIHVDTDANSMRAIAASMASSIQPTTLQWLEQFSSPRDVAEHLIAEEKGPGRTRIGYRDPPQGHHDCINAAGCFLIAGDSDNALKWADLAIKAARLPEGAKSMTEARDHIHRLIREGWTPPAPPAA